MTTLLTAYSAFTRASDLCVFAHDGNACCVLLTAFAMQRIKALETSCQVLFYQKLK